MAKHRLKLYDFDQDYLLIGIHSNSEIYKLAYEINSVLKISLKREKDIEFSNSNSVYPLYKYSSLKYDSKMFLFANKSLNFSETKSNTLLFNEIDETSLFFPEQSKIEFFLKIEDGRFNKRELLTKLNNCKNIISCYKISLKTDKSKYNLIFE